MFSMRSLGRKALAVLGGAGLVTLIAVPAQAQDAAPAAEPSFLEQVELFGLADMYYSWFSTEPEGGVDAQLRAFDQRHNSFATSMVAFGAAKVPTEDSRAGFRLDLSFGQAMRAFHATEPGGPGIVENFQEGYVSYLAPIGNGLQIDAGKFVTQVGAELTESKDNWNYSRAFLFFAGPYYHSGLRLGYAINDKVSVAGAVVNGWNNVTENNDGKSFNVQVAVKPNDKLSFIQNYIFGPELAGNDEDWRGLSDTTVTYAANDDLSLMVNYNYGTELDSNWQGVALYGRYQVSPTFAFSPRFEWFDDKDAWATLTSQTLKEFTLTGDVALTPSLSWKAEYRGDFSDTNFFAKRDGTFTDSQHSVGFAFMYAFSSAN
ncbi:MAG: porin [Acidobacteria bacterium]|nr:porin [Acidobacteriota bacterium]